MQIELIAPEIKWNANKFPGRSLIYYALLVRTFFPWRSLIYAKQTWP